MDEHAAETAPERAPWTYLVAKWYGYVFALVFLLYGGVSIILGILDRDYTNLSQYLIFLIVGIVLITICVGFRDRRPWGWYGLIVMHGLIILLALVHPGNLYNWLLIVLSAGSLGLLFVPVTRQEIF